MVKRVFIINGCAGVGKDTFVSMVGSLVPAANYSSVDEVKRAAKILGWNGEKDEKSRKFLSDIKVMTYEYSDYMYQHMLQKIEAFMEDDLHEFMFLHIREPEEIRRLKTDIPWIVTVLINNNNVRWVDSNMADANVHMYNYDEVIDNSGTLGELKVKAGEFVEKYGKNMEVNNGTQEYQ